MKNASGSDDMTVRIWDANSTTHNKDVGKEAINHTSLVITATFSPEELKLASVSSDGTVRIWDTSSGKLVRALSGHASDATSVSFSPDGFNCVSGSDDATARVWNIDTGDPLMELQGHKRSIRSLAYSPDGRYLASGSDDRTVVIWEAGPGEIIDHLQCFTHRVINVGFSSDGSKLVFGSDDGMMRVWDPSNGMLLDELKEDPRRMDLGLVAYSTAPWADVVIDAISPSDLRFWSVHKPAWGQCCLVLQDGTSMQVRSQPWIWGSNALRTTSVLSCSGKKACLGYLTGEIVILELPDE